MDNLLNLGVVGYSEGNGHPISFSSIINGFDDVLIDELNFPSIAQYLRDANQSYIGSVPMKVNHIWCGDKKLAEKIANATFIEQVHDSYTTFPFSELDGVLILMDDCLQRTVIIELMVENNVKIFVDKPLYSNSEMSEKYNLLLKDGRIMSCSCLRYDPQFDNVREAFLKQGAPVFTRSIITGDIRKYLPHALEPIISICGPLEVEKLENVSRMGLDGLRLKTSQTEIGILCLDSNIPLFKYDFYWDSHVESVQIKSNFLAFYHGIKAIEKFICKSVPVIEVNETKMICDTNFLL